MWTESYCPICKKELNWVESESSIKAFTKLACPWKINPDRSDIAHYEREEVHGTPTFERIFFLPFALESYPEVTNIYKIDITNWRRKFIVEVPYIHLPWDDLDKAVQKISLYTLLS